MYTDAHRLVVQAFLTRGVMDSKDMNDLVKQACERCGVELSPVERFIHLVNTRLQKMSMEIRRKREETSGVEVYALVQTSESEVGKLATDYHPKELELFKEIVSLIVTSEDGEASSTDCLNLADTLNRKISKDDAQNAMKRFVQERWLHIDEEGMVSLAARGIMELQMFLRETYPDDIMSCYLCQDIAVKGHVCSDCSQVKLHLFCAQRLFQSQPNPKCPSCENPWRHDIPHMNGVATDARAGSNETALVEADVARPSTSRQRKRTAPR